MSNTKPKLPISSFRKIKDEQVSNKNLSKSAIIETDSDNFGEDDEIHNKTHAYNVRNKDERKLHLTEEEEIFSNIEYTKTVVKALKEALEENEKVSLLD
jgi:hypothetical protein